MLTRGRAWRIGSDARQAFSSSYFLRIVKGTVARQEYWKEQLFRRIFLREKISLELEP